MSARRQSDAGAVNDPVRGSRHVRNLEVLEKSQEQSRAMQNRIEYLEEMMNSCAHIHEQAKTAEARVEEERAKAAEATRIALAELSERHDEKLRQVYAREQSTINHFTSERQALEARVAHLEQALAQATSKAAVLEQENNEMKGMIEHATGKVATLESVVLDLDGKAQTLQGVSDDLETLRVVFAEVDQRAKELEMDNGQLKERLKALSSGQEDPAISAMISDLRVDIDHLKQELRARDAAIEQLRAEVTRERDCVSQCTLEIARLNKELSSSTKECTELKERVQELSTNLAEAVKAANMYAAQAAAKKSNAAPSFEDFVSLSRQMSELKQENATMKRRASMLPNMFAAVELPVIPSGPSPKPGVASANRSAAGTPPPLAPASPGGSVVPAVPVAYKDEDGVVVVQKGSLPLMQRRSSFAQGTMQSASASAAAAAAAAAGGAAGGPPTKWASAQSRRASSAQINLPRGTAL